MIIDNGQQQRFQGKVEKDWRDEISLAKATLLWDVIGNKAIHINYNFVLEEQVTNTSDKSWCKPKFAKDFTDVGFLG